VVSYSELSNQAPGEEVASRVGQDSRPGILALNHACLSPPPDLRAEDTDSHRVALGLIAVGAEQEGPWEGVLAFGSASAEPFGGHSVPALQLCHAKLFLPFQFHSFAFVGFNT
jgi:hypothetical protein